MCSTPPSLPVPIPHAPSHLPLSPSRFLPHPPALSAARVRFEFHEQATKEQQATAAAQAAAQQQDSRAATPPPDMGGHTGGTSAGADRSGVLTVQLLEADKSEAPPTALEPVFAEYIK